ncbi:Uncharacterised protein [Micrococcus luteus]|nr:Uncharacterised protein [Micrococcus luteus]
MPQKYSPEFKARALKLIEERVRTEQCSGWVACTAVGEALGGISPTPCATGGSKTASIRARPQG